MAYVQHTHCVKSEDYEGLSAGIIAAGGVFFVLGAIIAAVGGGPIGVAVAIAGGLVAVGEVCSFLLGGKLICLGKNECAIGLVVGLEPPGYRKPFPENIDNDYSVNILLAPHFFTATAADIETDGVQGHFIAEQPESKAHGFAFAGYPTIGVEHNLEFEDVPALHCEFEGDRIANVCTTLNVLVPALAVASAFCAIPVIGWVICLIAAIIAAIVMAIVWAASGEGDPLDAAVTPEDGTLEIGRDYVVMRGDWCYDSGHTPGWNELHPVKSVQKIPLDWEELAPGDADRQQILDAFKLHYQDWCEATGEALDEIVRDEQKEPPHRWCLHPIVDGCVEEDPVPVPK